MRCCRERLSYKIDDAAQQGEDTRRSGACSATGAYIDLSCPTTSPATTRPVPILDGLSSQGSGPNTGKSGLGVTDTNGQTTFIYHDDGGAGQDHLRHLHRRQREVAEGHCHQGLEPIARHSRDTSPAR